MTKEGTVSAFRKVRNRSVSALLPFVLPVVLLVAWEVAAQRAQSVYFPPLTDVIEVFRNDWYPDIIMDDLLPSLTRFGVGYVLGSTVGIVLGVAVGSSRRVAEYLEPTLEFLRAVPAVAVVPIAVLFLGLGSSMRVSVIIFGVMFPVLLNTVVGVRSTRPERIDSARVFGLSWWAVIWRVKIPSALPLISAGLRIALPIALIMMIVSEFAGGQNGLGAYLQRSQPLFHTAAIFSAIVVLGVIGNLLNALYAWFEGRLLPWSANL